MHKSADEFAEKAEKLRDITFIAKSNSLHHTAKDKELELRSVTDQLEASCIQLQDLQEWLLYCHVISNISDGIVKPSIVYDVLNLAWICSLKHLFHKSFPP